MNLQYCAEVMSMRVWVMGRAGVRGRMTDVQALMFQYRPAMFRKQKFLSDTTVDRQCGMGTSLCAALGPAPASMVMDKDQLVFCPDYEVFWRNGLSMSRLNILK